MKLLDLVLINFLSYKKQKIDLSQYKTLIITGMNGSGKSSIFEAIVWCLFGKCRVKMEYIKNTNLHKAKIVVKLSFELNNKVYKIIRRCKKHQTLEIYENDKLLEFATTTLAQEYIEKLLGTNYTLFLYTNYLRQGTINNFSNLQLAEKKSLLGTIFNFEKYKVIYRKVYKNLQEIKEKISNIQFYLNDKEEIVNKNEISETIDKYNKQIKEVMQQIKEIDIDKLNKHVERDKQIDKIKYQINSNDGYISQKKRDIEEKNKLITTSKEQCKYIERVGCPFLKGTFESIDKINKSIEQLKLGQKELNKQLEKIGDQPKSNVQEKIDQYQELMRNKFNIEGKIKENELLLKSGSEEVDKIKQYKKKLKKYGEGKEVYSSLVDIFGNNGFTLYLITQYSQYLNEIIERIKNKFLLYDVDIKFTISDVNDLSSFGLMFKKNNRELDYDNFSGGQRIKIDFAIRFSFIELLNRMYGKNIPIIFLDEFAELDSPNLELVIGLIEGYAKEYSQVFITSHLMEIKDRFDDVILVKSDKYGNSVVANND